jgi:predicted nucleic acid-binding protein
MSVVVSDISPLRALAHLGHVEWLQVLFNRVLLPPAVAFELRNPPPAYRSIEVSEWAFLEVLAPTNTARVAELRSSLDVGEAEAITLAEEIEADVVLIDEMAGRETARIRGFTVLGTLGLLVRAKRRGLLPSVAPLLDRLRSELNFFISDELRRTILRQGEEYT